MRRTLNISLGKYKFPKSGRRESEEDTKLVKAQNGTGLPAIISFIPCCCESSRHETMIKRKKKKGISIREGKKKNIIVADNMTVYLETQRKQLKTHKNYYESKKFLQNKYIESLFLSYMKTITIWKTKWKKYQSHNGIKNELLTYTK